VRSLRLPALAALSVLIACSAQRSSTRKDEPLASEVQAPGLRFHLLYRPADAPEVQRLRTELVLIAPTLSRWGEFRRPVAIEVHPDHAALEDAIDRHGYPWLHAWTDEEEVLIESPRGWSQAQIDELLTHELTHALMYQLVAGGALPFWFREGMASVTAQQGYRRMPLSALATWRSAHPGLDVLNPDAPLYRTEREAVYGAAHRAFEALLDEVGDNGVRRILGLVGDGQPFAQAFTAVAKREVAAFERGALEGTVVSDRAAR